MNDRILEFIRDCASNGEPLADVGVNYLLDVVDRLQNALELIEQRTMESETALIAKKALAQPDSRDQERK